MAVFSLSLYVVGAVVLGISMFPGLCLCVWLWHSSAGWPEVARLFLVSLGLGASYFIYGVTVMFVTAFICRAFHLRLKPGRHAFMSLPVFKWVVSGGLANLARVTFLDFVTLTPLMNLYLRAMGATVSAGAMVNSKHLYDVSLLTVEEGAVIGGDAILTCHIAERDHIVFKPIVIGRKSLVGSGAYIMPGVHVGERVIIGAHAVVLKDSILPSNTMWGGVPARQLERHPEAPPS